MPVHPARPRTVRYSDSLGAALLCTERGGRHGPVGYIAHGRQDMKGKIGEGEVEDTEKEPFLRPTHGERTCGKCYALSTCMVHRKVNNLLVLVIFSVY